jgi:hypothetical protein
MPWDHIGFVEDYNKDVEKREIDEYKKLLN